MVLRPMSQARLVPCAANVRSLDPWADRNSLSERSRSTLENTSARVASNRVRIWSPSDRTSSLSSKTIRWMSSRSRPARAPLGLAVALCAKDESRRGAYERTALARSAQGRRCD
jgi:hypothetical protein